jgi:hypothetical protein
MSETPNRQEMVKSRSLRSVIPILDGLLDAYLRTRNSEGVSGILALPRRDSTVSMRRGRLPLGRPPAPTSISLKGVSDA